VEGATGVGAYLAQRLPSDGETVIDVPVKLSTRARIFAIGHGRKNDPADARTVAVVALRTRGLPEVGVGVEDEMVALRLLSDRRTELVARRTATVNRAHQLLAELITSGAGKDLTAATATAMLATVRPRDVAGRTRRALAVELVTDVTRADTQIAAVDAQLGEVVAATGTSLTDIKGVGVVMAALILGEVGTSGGPRPITTSRPTPAAPPPRPAAGRSPATGSPVPGTGGSTTPCTSPR